jgi:fructose-1,6-bisphosphatase/inositol monophosphatase family enzyme
MTIAEQAAREAGKIIIAGIQSEASNLDITSKIGSRDLVTKVFTLYAYTIIDNKIQF